MRALALSLLVAVAALGPGALARGPAAALAQPAAAPPMPPPPPPTPSEMRPSKPSGFWGSGRPSSGGAYRWRMLGVGAVLLGAMGLVILRLVRRASRARAAR